MRRLRLSEQFPGRCDRSAGCARFPVQPPVISIGLQKDQKVGVLCADGPSLSSEIVQNCGADPSRCIVKGLEDQPQMAVIVKSNSGSFDSYIPRCFKIFIKMCGQISRRNRSTKSLSRKNTVGDFPRFFCSPETPNPPQGGALPLSLKNVTPYRFQ